MDAQTAIGDMIDKDSRRRDRILTLYGDIKDLLERDTYLRHIMTTEFEDVTQDLDKLRSEIMDTVCPILVAGETSSGKSSMINLIIGKQILPERLLSSTSTICKIWNSEEKKLVLTDLENKKETHTFDSDDYIEKMKDILIQTVGSYSDNNPWKSADIFLPVPVLQKNIPIVDTPGIGKRKKLMERLFDYLPNALAFIYVINAGNAGGVEYDDWLQKILMTLSEQHSKGNMLDFDTETTLFVCNKWDQVDNDEEPAVLDVIVRKLRYEWPKFNPDQQLFKLSCKKEKKRIRKKSQPSQNYQSLVQGIRDMMPKTLEAKLIRHIRWQKFFVERMIDRIGLKITLSKQAMGERERRKNEAERRLKLLEKKLEKVKKSALAKIDEKCKAISKEIVDHLNAVKENMFMWNEIELPESKDMNCIREKASELIQTKINHQINEWRLRNTDEIESELENILTKEFKIIEDDLRIAEDCFHSFSGYSSEDFRIWSKLTSLTKHFHLGIGAAIVTSPLLFCGLIGIAIYFGEILPLVYLYHKKNKSSMAKYTENKVECMREWADIILQQKFSEDKIYTQMEPFLKNMTDKITFICETLVPKRIAADKICIDDAINETRSDLEILRQYSPIQRHCEMIIGKIEIVSMEYFPMSPASFRYIHNVDLGDQIGSGSFSIVHSATISINNKDIVAAVKTSKFPIDNMLTYKEVSEALILRRIQENQNVMKLYGLSFKQDAETKFLQILMEHCEDNLYNIVMVKRTPRACGSFQILKDCTTSWTFVLRVMEGLCSALDYIHDKGFVHRDLKLANVMVKGECSVRLADFGLSKKEVNITGTLAGTPLYMAPEVYMGHLYGTEADIYSLGIIIYELWYYRPVFTVPLRADSTEFEFIVNTEEELKDYVTSRDGRPDLDIAHKPPTNLKNIMRKCWNKHKSFRPSAKEVYKRMCELEFN